MNILCKNCKYNKSEKHHDVLWCRDCNSDKNHFALKNTNNIVQDHSSAFPIDGMYASDAIKNGTTGLSKRMYIAIQAVNGMLSHSGFFDDKAIIEGYVHRAYAIADEIIKQEKM